MKKMGVVKMCAAIAPAIPALHRRRFEKEYVAALISEYGISFKVRTDLESRT